MELQQNSNLIARILKQTVGLQHICQEDFILNIKGKQYTHFVRFLEMRQSCAVTRLRPLKQFHSLCSLH